jgi:hypothetical protein
MDEARTMLTSLTAQAEREGVHLVTLRALIEEASESGAERALGALGLAGPAARRDMDELRELLQAWRDAKKTARGALIGWLVRVLLALVVLGMAVRLGALELIR